MLKAIEKEEKKQKIKSIDEYNKEQEALKKAKEAKKVQDANVPKKPVVFLKSNYTKNDR